MLQHLITHLQQATVRQGRRAMDALAFDEGAVGRLQVGDGCLSLVRQRTDLAMPSRHLGIGQNEIADDLAAECRRLAPDADVTSGLAALDDRQEVLALLLERLGLGVGAGDRQDRVILRLLTVGRRTFFQD